jgi:hypothetical protein
MAARAIADDWRDAFFRCPFHLQKWKTAGVAVISLFQWPVTG